MRPPSVDSLANSLLDTGLPQPLCVDVARAAIDAGDPDSARRRAENLIQKMLRSVINATGVLLHTNMGRAPLGFTQPPSYTNLEIDLETGQRGSRQSHLDFILAKLTGAEAALVVNNCSAAVTLILAALSGEDEGDAGKEQGKKAASVAVSRGELVEIGGGFRVPEVIAQSGARLIEVGTTNRTRLKDYERAVKKSNARLILKVHQSNYALKGFTESVRISELAQLKGRMKNAMKQTAGGTGGGTELWLIADIGSGLIDAACPWLDEGPPGWLAGEPAAKQILSDGADMVAFSGDKLFGGPQAGIIAGREELIAKCASHPLARTFRPGGLIISALLETALKYLNKEETLFWQMATAKPETLKQRAEKVAAAANEGTGTGAGGTIGGQFRVEACMSVPGGGTLPEVEIPSFGVATDGDRTAELRETAIPVIARVFGGRTILDLRTVFPEQDDELIKALKNLP